jgi:elongation factor G
VKTYDSAKIRNVVLLGAGGSGKTSFAESVLFKTGATTRRGQTNDGTSVLDSSPEELKRKMTVNLGLAPVEFDGFKINILDAPGFADYCGEAEAALAAADMAVIFVNATSGVEPDTERLFEISEKAGKPVVFVMNHMDKENADFMKSVNSVKEGLTRAIVPFQVPIGVGADFKGVADVVAGTAFLDEGKGNTAPGEMPADIAGEVESMRADMAEAAAESDDALLEKYLEEGELSEEEISNGLRGGVLKGKVYPALAYSAETDVALDRVLRFITDWAPSPIDAKTPNALREGQEESTPLDGKNDGPSVAQIFKTYYDERLGEYSLLRCYSGSFSSGDYYNPRKQTAIRIGAIYGIRGKERIDYEKLVFGDIAATPRLKNTGVNDTLATKDNRVLVDPIQFSEPLHTVAIGAAGSGGEEKIAGGLSKLQDFDPTLVLTVDSALKQTLISGMGDQHIDVQLERLRTRLKVEAETRKPKIPYRETIVGRVDDIQGRYKKQTGGRGQFGDVHLKIEPQTRGVGFEFVDAIVGGVIPSKFIPAVEKGIRECMDRGVLVGYPVVDVKTTLHFGSYHDVDSSENAFKMAGAMAFKDGFMQCKPVLLEPVMKLALSVPEEYTGDIMGDMSSRRGRIQGMELSGKRQVVTAEAPMNELFGYVASLRSMTQGRGRFTMTVSHYEEVPRDVQAKLVEAIKKEQEDS